MSSLLTDSLDSAGSTFGDIFTSALQGVKEVAQVNIKNAVTNATTKHANPIVTTHEGAFAPVTTGTDANGATLAPGVTHQVPGATHTIPKWAIGLGIGSALLLVVGVVVLAAKG